MQLVKYVLPSVLAILLITGCAGTKESAQKDELTANVGQYPPPPSGITKARVGVPPFAVQAQGGMQGGDLNGLAADQMSTLLDQTGRFDIIERAQLQKVLDEQNMEGIVKAGELAKTGEVRGVDYLLLGKVTNLRVKQDRTKKGFNLAGLGGIVDTHGAGYNQKDTRITTECGVDVRLVDPTSGKVWVSNFSEFKRTDEASAMGISVFGATAGADADIQMSEDDKGKVLRLALDDAIRKSLPKIDKFLKSSSAASAANAPAASAAPAARPSPAAPPSPAAAPSSIVPAAPAAQPAVAKKFCPQCGKEVAGGAKFCGSCGGKLD